MCGIIYWGAVLQGTLGLNKNQGINVLLDVLLATMSEQKEGLAFSEVCFHTRSIQTAAASSYIPLLSLQASVRQVRAGYLLNDMTSTVTMLRSPDLAGTGPGLSASSVLVSYIRSRNVELLQTHKLGTRGIGSTGIRDQSQHNLQTPQFRLFNEMPFLK